MCYKDLPPPQKNRETVKNLPKLLPSSSPISPTPLPHAPRPPHPAQHLLILSSYS